MKKLATFKIKSLPPFVKPVMKFINAVVSLYEKVKGDVMKFFNVSIGFFLVSIFTGL